MCFVKEPMSVLLIIWRGKWLSLRESSEIDIVMRWFLYNLFCFVTCKFVTTYFYTCIKIKNYFTKVYLNINSLTDYSFELIQLVLPHLSSTVLLWSFKQKYSMALEEIKSMSYVYRNTVYTNFIKITFKIII